MTIILWLILLIVAGLVVYGAMQPAAFRIERSIDIKAAPDRIFDLLEDFRRWRSWSPWENLDPNLQRSYSGSERGVGAAYGWSGNRKAGVGRMEIIEAEAPNRVLIRLDFEKPFKASNRVEILVRPEGDGSHVSWAMFGRLNFIMRMMQVAFDMDKAVGPDFERGLANLKTAAEAPALK